MSVPSVIPLAPVTTKKHREIARRIKFESELDLAFGESMAEKAYGQRLLSCIQCGTCSATCPLSHYMDFTPRRIIAMTREGFRDEVLNSLTIWLCASCYSCTVQCPRQIHITDVMYTLKREAMARGVHPKHHPIPVLAREFFEQVRHHGRNTESHVLVRLFLRTKPWKMFKEAWLGFTLWRKGRLSPFREKIHGIASMRAILASSSPKNGGRPS
jgi:quinone-modifying oxidoreductase, subunit QmoC